MNKQPEITARAGYNRGTFYEYFADVRQCLDLIETRSLPRLDDLPPMPEDSAPSPDFIESFIGLYKEKFKYYDVLLGDRGDPSFQRRLIDCIKVAIVNSRKLPAFIGTVELDYMLEYILSGMIGIMRYYFHSRPKGSQGEAWTEEYQAEVYRRQLEAILRSDAVSGLAQR